MYKKPVVKSRKFSFLKLPQNILRLRFARLHPALVPVLTFVALLLITLGGYMSFTHNHVEASDSFIVIVSHDGGQQTVPTREATVGDLVKKLNIKLGKGDVVEPSEDTAINQDDFRINIYRAVPVEVVDGAVKQFTFSAATTPRAIAVQTGSTVYPEDDLDTTPTTNFLADGAIGERVVIKRATPVTVNLYGNDIAVRTQAKTVGDLLKEKSITLEKGDSVSPVVATRVAPDMQVLISRKGTKLAVSTQTIAMPVQTISDPDLAYGTSAIRQHGSPGKKVTTYEIILKNGKEVGRKIIQTAIVEKPVKQIEVVGTSLSGIKGDMALAGISPSDYTYADYIISHESGWCPTKWQGEYGGCPAYHGAPSASSGLGYGLGQSTPASNMAAYGSDWATNPVTQLKWANGYAKSHWGSWYAAYSHWVATGNW